MSTFKNRKVFSFILASIIIAFSPAISQAKDLSKDVSKEKIEKKDSNSTSTHYMLPPKEMIKIVDAKNTPLINLSPNNEWVLLLDPNKNLTMEELVKRELRLAGTKINPETSFLSRSNFYTSIKIKNLTKGDYVNISGIPENSKINYISWSPDSKNIAFTITKSNSVTLWIADVVSKKAHELTKLRLNATIGKPYAWLSDSKKLLCLAIPSDMGEEPKEKSIPDSPLIQESLGKKLKLRVYENLLKNTHDEDLFTHYFTSQLVTLDLNGNIKKIGTKDVFCNVEPSPDSKYIIVERILKPYSYVVPMTKFPRKIQVWSMDGTLIKNMATLPLQETKELSPDNYSILPRNYKWRSDTPATLYWAQKKSKKDNDIVYALKAPFKDKPTEILSFENNFQDIIWGDNKVALAYEEIKSKQKTKIWLFPPDFQEFKPKLLIEKNNEDRYKDVGIPVTTNSKYGTDILLKDDKHFSLYFYGLGASEEGNKPFIDKLDLKSTKAQRLWQSQKPYYEEPIKIINQDELKLITKIESTTKQPNYYIRNVAKNKIVQISNFEHPYPEFKNIKKEVIKYKRADGITLSANLYLPADYKKEQGKLPVLIWAYPREYDNADFAGQITESPYAFMRIKPNSPIIFATQGYAVLDKPSIPIVAEGKGKPNDTYINQLVSSTKAAVDKIVSMGIADPNKIAIGGHSYGAFMTANLLAHSDLFCAGISRSGAYNRTLTPFGFQNEERSLWENPKLYSDISVFNYADKIKSPLLLIHGMNDDNAGTNPIQSQNMFNAINKLGGKARLVMLPNETHHYQARESILHVLWEMNEWLEKYVKKTNKDLKNQK